MTEMTVGEGSLVQQRADDGNDDIIIMYFVKCFCICGELHTQKTCKKVYLSVLLRNDRDKLVIG